MSKVLMEGMDVLLHKIKEKFKYEKTVKGTKWFIFFFSASLIWKEEKDKRTLKKAVSKQDRNNDFHMIEYSLIQIKKKVIQPDYESSEK